MIRDMKRKRGLLLFLTPAFVMLWPLITWLQHQRASQIENTRAISWYKPQAGPTPRFVTYYFAGVDLRQTPKADACDLKSNYCVEPNDGPDGCELSLRLAPSDKCFKGYAPDVVKELKQISKKSRLSLATGRGIRIGDTPQQVKQKIGAPTEQWFKNGRAKYQYAFRGSKIYYEASYTFDSNRLVEIEAFQADAPTKTSHYLGFERKSLPALSYHTER